MEVARIIDAVVSLVDYSARRGGIVLHRDIAEGLPAVKCDADQLQQVVLDLVLNAIQAMPEGGKVILSAWSQDSNVLIHVKDEGCGIAEPDLEKIFDPFFTTKESGTGLGLSVVHQIVRQHGGRITLERNIDKGMTFTLLLPAHNGGMAADR